MIKQINRSVFLLQRKSVKANPFKDKQDAIDLLDTLRFHSSRCVGMAANMIGVHKNIIAFLNDNEHMVMFNPEIVKKEGPYQVKEGCLSLDGERETTRYEKIIVSYQDMNGKKKTKTFVEFNAQIIQHEIDHCNGIII